MVENFCTMSFEEGKKELCTPLSIGRILYYDSWLDGYKLNKYLISMMSIEGYSILVCEGYSSYNFVESDITDEMLDDGWHVIVERDEMIRDLRNVDIRDFKIGLNTDIYDDELKTVRDKFDNEKQMLDELIDFCPSWIVRAFIAENKN